MGEARPKLITGGLICAVCPTYNRPELLGRAIRSFEKQTYEDRFLLIVDDLGQYKNQEGDRWQLISFPRRFNSLGEKRNFIASIVPPETWAYAVWDDDDLYMPWHLESLAEALHRGEIVHSKYAVDYFDGRWTLVETFRFRKTRISPMRLSYHGCWGYTRKLFYQMGGYPHISFGDDGKFYDKVIKAKIKSVFTDPRFGASYFYNRVLQTRISETKGACTPYWTTDKFPYVGEVPKWTDESEWDREIPTELVPRPW